MSGRARAEASTERIAASGRRLDPRISQDILEATLDLLAAEGYARLSMEAVAHRAGVHKPAVYRRWPTKIDLVAAAISNIASDVDEPARGNMRDDLVTLVSDAARAARRNPKVTAALRLLAETAADDALAAAVRARVTSPRRTATRAVLERGVARGEILPDVDLDLVVDVLFGTVHSRLLVSREPLSRRDVERLVDLVLGGIERRT